MNIKRNVCNKCGKVVSKQDNFCPYCGAYQKAVCSVCGKTVKDADAGNTIFICNRKCGIMYLAKLGRQVRKSKNGSETVKTDTDPQGI